MMMENCPINVSTVHTYKYMIHNQATQLVNSAVGVHCRESAGTKSLIIF